MLQYFIPTRMLKEFRTTWIFLVLLPLRTCGNSTSPFETLLNSQLTSNNHENWHSDTISPYFEPKINSASDFYLREMLKQLTAINKKIDRAMIRLIGSTVKGDDNDENIIGKYRSNFTEPNCESLIGSNLPSGIYHFSTKFPTRTNWIWNIFEIYCDQSCGGGWTVIQRRGNINGQRVNFTRSWDDYAKGFGELNGEFWLGNEWIHRLTTLYGPYELRIELENSLGRKFWAQYSEFTVTSSKENYRLEINGYTGNYTDSSSSDNSSDFDSHNFRSDHTHLNYPCQMNFGGLWWYPNNCIGGNFTVNSDYYENTKMMIRSKNHRYPNVQNDQNTE